MKPIIKTNDKQVAVQADYNAIFVSRAKGLGGRWNKPYWVFSIEDKDRVIALVAEIYGNDDMPTTKLRIMLDVCGDSLVKNNGLILHGRSLAYRATRDSHVRLGDGVMMVAGDWCEWGGSKAKPRVTWVSGTVLEVRGYPVAWCDDLPDGCQIIND